MRPRVDCITARQLVQDDVEQDVAENIVHRHPFPFAFSQNYCANLLDLPISFLLNLLLHIYIYIMYVYSLITNKCHFSTCRQMQQWSSSVLGQAAWKLKRPLHLSRNMYASHIWGRLILYQYDLRTRLVVLSSYIMLWSRGHIQPARIDLSW